MAKTDWNLHDTVQPEDMNALGEELNQLRTEVDHIDIPPASLITPGIVQLSNATDSVAEDKAATAKAVKDVALEAKSYTDQQINLVTETGIPKLVSYPLKVVASTDNQKVFEIPLDVFDANTDTLLVAINRASLDPTQYSVTNTVRNGDGEVTQRAKITFIFGIAATSEVTMVVLKNVPLGEDGTINGAVLAMDSVPINRVNGLQGQLDQAFRAGNERKAEVVAALVAMGVSASTGESWDSLIAKMSAIIKATGNAGVEDVLSGKTFSNLRANELKGTIPTHGAGGTITPGTTNQRKEAGYYSGAITILGDAKLLPVNLPKDTTIFGVTGLLERLTTTERNAIISAIVSKGVAATIEDSNAILAQKIGQIVTGKRWAIGKFTIGTNGQGGVNNLAFRPRNIIFSNASNYNSYIYFGVYSEDSPVSYGSSITPTNFVHGIENGRADRNVISSHATGFYVSTSINDLREYNFFATE